MSQNLPGKKKHRPFLVEKCPCFFFASYFLRKKSFIATFFISSQNSLKLWKPLYIFIISYVFYHGDYFFSSWERIFMILNTPVVSSQATLAKIETYGVPGFLEWVLGLISLKKVSDPFFTRKKTSPPFFSEKKCSPLFFKSKKVFAAYFIE